MIDILLTSFIFATVLLGIHSYYGIHIIRRGIIFTDLAIGQMAALGTAIAFLIFDGSFIYPVSLSFALIGAFLIALTSKKRINHEAFIGLIYAIGISLSIIVLSKNPHGTEEVQKLTASDILFITKGELIKVSVLYATIGLFLFFVVEKVEGTIKEVLFFTSFAITVTSSVNLAGVLVVFSILVAPAYIMSFFTHSFSIKLIGAWILGILINIIAILFSYYLDLPTGYTIVAFYAFSGIIVSLICKCFKSETSNG
ncbi:MAG: metal ABC transporter permease [Deltaproteobacteria bacterium]|nr:metal ABC transporter permease [Deltaproteobacteria bacterium]